MKLLSIVSILTLCGCVSTQTVQKTQGQPGQSLMAATTTLVGTSNPVANYQFDNPGWATFGLALPKGEVKSTEWLQVGPMATQTDVKTTWDDGSIRFAVVTAGVDKKGVYPITAVPAKIKPKLTPSWPSVSVNFTVSGVTYKAVLPSYDGSNPWLLGHLVNESRVVVAPKASGVAHPLLQVIYDVRSYSNNWHRVDITVQNTKDITEGAPVKYDVAVMVNGVKTYSKANVTHAYLTRWRKVLPVGGLIEAQVVPDFEPFYLANAIPRYISTVNNPKPNPNWTKFDILGFGDFSEDMSSPGGRPEIAPYPNFTAQYLVHKRPEMKTYMLASGNLSGSWRGHITEPDGLTLISLDKWPTYWLDGRAGTTTVPVYGATGPNATRVQYQGGPWPGGFSYSIETAHMPSLNYVPYLVTGNRFDMDQMKFWANFAIIGTWARGGDGLLINNQPRGIGWAIRNIADVAAYIPDADPMSSYFKIRMMNNIKWIEDTAKTYNGGPFNFVFISNGYTSETKVTSLWQNSYIGWSLDHANKQGFANSLMLKRIVAVQVLFFNSEAEGYPKIAGAPYYPTVMKADATGTVVYLKTMKEIYDASWAADPRTAPFAGYYGPEARMMLQIGARDGVPLAQSSLNYLMPFIQGDIDFRSGWAVQP